MADLFEGHEIWKQGFTDQLVVSEERYSECKNVNKSVILQPTTQYPFVKYVGVDAVYLFVHKWYKAVYVNIYMDTLHSFIVYWYWKGNVIILITAFLHSVNEVPFHCNTVTIFS